MINSSKVNTLNITMFTASYGDSFLVSVAEDNLDILIDTGFKSTYEDHIKPKLTEIVVVNKDQNLDSINVPIQRKIVTTKIETHFWTKTLQSRMTALCHERTVVTLDSCYIPFTYLLLFWAVALAI
ncbi:hypothetical protein [Pseudoalteromonas sp. Q18-MNA-CIBAN-0097]|uniref:hypothetical protein n=1 Tax=Pseudoalteromonas sp. Q18-MNA-CIBAN-0097 TaxID=3140440 RepID=UPI0033209519